MEKECFWRLLARHLSGEASASEMEELQRMLAAEPLLHKEASILEAAWRCRDQAAELKPDEQLASLLERIRKQP